MSLCSLGSSPERKWRARRREAVALGRTVDAVRKRAQRLGERSYRESWLRRRTMSSASAKRGSAAGKGGGKVNWANVLTALGVIAAILIPSMLQVRAAGRAAGWL